MIQPGSYVSRALSQSAPRVARQVVYYPIAGGLDQVTPSIQKGPGLFEASANFELDINGGAQRVGAYERYDGRPSPSDASYHLLGFDAGTDEFADGETVTGGNSGATGVVLEVVLASGTWAGNDAAGTLVLARVAGAFEDNEPLTSASGAGVADGVATENDESDPATHYGYLELAADDARALISAPAGSGAVRGVHLYNGDRYCWRDNAGGTAKVLFKATTGGWVAQDLGRRVAYTSGGTYEVKEGDVITGATSGATATVRRVILDSGTWAGGDAVGRFVIYGQSGTFQAENLNVGASTNVATIAGNSTAQTLAAGGRVEAVNANFRGQASTIRMYWVDGVSKAFEWDGTTAVEIDTGMPTDKPSHVEFHRYYLFLSFPGGSLQNSGVGDPYDWTLRSGANEFGVSDEIVGLKSARGVLAIFARNRTWTLYGSSASDWDLRDYSSQTGCIEWSLQELWEPVYFDDRGITLLSATDAFGDFAAATISQRAQPLINAKKHLVTASLVSHDLNRVRWFFSDGTGITLTARQGQVLGLAATDWGRTFVVAARGEDAAGDEVLLAGDSAGMVFELERGSSFDGAEIEAWMQLSFWHYKTPRAVKSFRRITPEIVSSRSIALKVRPDFDYGSSAVGEPTSIDVIAGGGTWDISNWDEFIWDTQAVSQPGISIDGDGLTMGIALYQRQKAPSWSVQGLLTDFFLRRTRYSA